MRKSVCVCACSFIYDKLLENCKVTRTIRISLIKWKKKQNNDWERENSSHNVVQMGIRHTVRRPIKTYILKIAINVGRENLCAHATLHAYKCDLSIRIINEEKTAMNESARHTQREKKHSYNENVSIEKCAHTFEQCNRHKNVVSPYAGHRVSLLPRSSRNITVVLFSIIKVIR